MVVVGAVGTIGSLWGWLWADHRMTPVELGEVS
jgi:hypothetical protein